MWLLFDVFVSFASLHLPDVVLNLATVFNPLGSLLHGNRLWLFEWSKRSRGKPTAALSNIIRTKTHINSFYLLCSSLFPKQNKSMMKRKKSTVCVCSFDPQRNSFTVFVCVCVREIESEKESNLWWERKIESPSNELLALHECRTACLVALASGGDSFWFHSLEFGPQHIENSKQKRHQ